jgi:DNA-binding MurR/RpiR family transcriptional regulator
MTGHGEKLSRKHEQAISALLATPTVAEAAHQAGVSESTVRRWLQSADFQAAYQQARRQVVQQAIVQVQQTCTVAVTTLRTVMQEATAPASARVSAAKAVLDTALKAVELEDLEARIAALEADRPQRGAQD